VANEREGLKKKTDIRMRLADANLVAPFDGLITDTQPDARGRLGREGREAADLDQ